MRTCFIIAALMWAAGISALTQTVVPDAVESPADYRGCVLSKCHGTPGAFVEKEDGSTREMTVNTNHLVGSAHNKLACIECHSDIDEIPHPSDLKPVNCEHCHYEQNPRGAPNVGQFKQYPESVHGRERAEGNEDAPYCTDCHGIHDVKSSGDVRSTVHRKQLASTCGGCHEDESTTYTTSIHGVELANDNPDTPACTDCHGVHDILRPGDPESPVHSTHVVETCSECHAAVALADKYDFSALRVDSYEESFHGLADKYDVTVVANCSSCHGIHNILPHTETDSTIHEANLLKTCGQTDCHPNAQDEFATGEVHMGIAEAPPLAVSFVRALYMLLIVGVIGAMAVHNLFDLRAVVRHGRAPRRGRDA